MAKFVTQPAVRDGHSPRAPRASDATAIETVTAITGLIGDGCMRLSFRV
ncbi:MAG: hypothetical protein WD823_08175 [Sulfuricaulis sp.]